MAARDLFSGPIEEPAKAKTLEIERMALNYFKGIKARTVFLGYRNLDVYGTNGTGKTTLFDAFLWVFTGKDSQGKEDVNFGIKTLEGTEAIPQVDHEVEIECRYNGRRLNLKKVFAEKWVTKRGEAQPTFQGHETRHYINNVPVAKGKFDEQTNQLLMSDQVFRLVSDPNYFAESLHWQEKRNILLDVAGGVTDAEIIEAMPELEELLELTEDVTIGDFKAVLNANRKLIDKELKAIPIRVSEVHRSLAEIDGVDREELQGQIDTLRAEKNDKQGELLRAEQDGGATDIVVRLLQVKAKMQEIEIQGRKEHAERVSQKYTEQATLKADVLALEKEMPSGDLSYHMFELKEIDQRLDELRDKWDDVYDTEFTYNPILVCPTCEQPLPASKVEDARRKALEAFNLAKSNELDEIEIEGEAAKKKRDAVVKTIEESEREYKTVSQKLNVLRKTYERALGEYNDLNNQYVTPNSKEYVALANERTSLELQIEGAEEGNDAITMSIKREIQALDKKIFDLVQTQTKLDTYEKGKNRIEELKELEKKYAKEYDDISRQVYLCEKWDETQAGLLEKKVAEHFQYARFRLFERQVNGALKEVCEVTDPSGVPWGKGLNRGACMNIGLDIINTLSRHYGLIVPIWVDNAEAVVNLIPTQAQVIRLFVSEGDEELRFVQ